MSGPVGLHIDQYTFSSSQFLFNKQLENAFAAAQLIEKGKQKACITKSGT